MLVVASIFFIQKNEPKDSDNKKDNIGDPFANMAIPEEFDEATRAVAQKKIDLTKEAYLERPNIWETWIGIGNLKVLLKDYQGAIDAYRQSLILQSNNILGYRGIAEVYNKNLEDFEKAEEYYKLAIENNPVDPEIYISLALVQDFRLNNPEAAENTYLNGLNRTDNHSSILNRLINFYKKKGDAEKQKKFENILQEKILNDQVDVPIINVQ